MKKHTFYKRGSWGSWSSWESKNTVLGACRLILSTTPRIQWGSWGVVGRLEKC